MERLRKCRFAKAGQMQYNGTELCQYEDDDAKGAGGGSRVGGSLLSGSDLVLGRDATASSQSASEVLMRSINCDIGSSAVPSSSGFKASGPSMRRTLRPEGSAATVNRHAEPTYRISGVASQFFSPLASSRFHTSVKKYLREFGQEVVK